jgi:hypothetical protein
MIQINKSTNKTTDYSFNIIHITKENDNNDIKDNKVLLSSMIEDWFSKKVGDNDYKFENIPFLIPVYIDMRDPYTKLNTKYINIMEGFSFKNICNNLQNTITWDINSLICETKEGSYYTLIKYNGYWTGFSDNIIPSNWLVDMTDLSTVKKIMKEVIMVFYKL